MVAGWWVRQSNMQWECLQSQNITLVAKLQYIVGAMFLLSDPCFDTCCTQPKPQGRHAVGQCWRTSLPLTHVVARANTSHPHPTPPGEETPFASIAASEIFSMEMSKTEALTQVRCAALCCAARWRCTIRTAQSSTLVLSCFQPAFARPLGWRS